MDILSLLNTMLLPEQAQDVTAKSLAMAAMGSCNPGGIVLLTVPALSGGRQGDLSKKSCWPLKINWACIFIKI